MGHANRILALLVTAIYFLLLIGNVNGLKILCIYPLSSHSHHKVGYTLMRELARRGHNITFVGPFPEKEPVKNMRTIVLTGFAEDLEEYRKPLTPGVLHQLFLSGLFYFPSFGTPMLEATLAHENVQNLLRSNEQFDIVFVEQFVYDGLLAIASHFDAPSAMISTFGPMEWWNHLVGNPNVLSYMGNIYIEPPIHTSFWKRVYNLLLYAIRELHHHLDVYPAQNRMIQKYIPNSPHIYDIIYNTSLILYNSHAILHQARPKAPNVIEIGGFHIQPPKKLPNDLQKILDNAENGVVYFSMGSLVRAEQLSVEMRNEILRAFSKLKETVLWKFDGNLYNIPSNVIIRSWLPQQDLLGTSKGKFKINVSVYNRILAHPNVKLFITHGGQLSIIESTHNGVPIIGIPVFGDQIVNVADLVDRGNGVKITLSELSEQTLTNALNEVLRNPKYFLIFDVEAFLQGYYHCRYAEAAKRSSEILKDHQINPVDKAEYWIKYVVRHKGAKHLRLPSLDLAWYQLASLDVLAFLIVVAVMLFYIFYRIIRWLLHWKGIKKQKLL